MRVLAFVDYDNVREVFERTALDVTLNLEDLLDRLSALVQRSVSNVEELDVRLYGGWVDEDGRYSRNAEWAFGAIASVRGRRGGVRLNPRLIMSAACQPHDTLIGTVRLRARPPRQKMVDGLMTIDALHLASEPFSAFLIVSDDDDLVPCALAVRRIVSAPCFLLCLRAPGGGLNDAILKKNGVHLGLLRP